MFKISQTSRNGPIYPDHTFLSDYEASNFRDFASTLSMDATIAILKDNAAVWQVGDSGIYISITRVDVKGPEATHIFDQYIKDLVRIISMAIPAMSSEYAAFYRFFIEAYETNGLNTA